MMRALESGLTAIKRLMLAVARLIVRIGSAIAEMNYHQQRHSAIRQSLDRYIENPFQAPETYAEFLLRTSGPLRREPSARQRMSGHPVH
jgi:hypothetical protein